MYASPDIADCRLPIADWVFCEEELYQVRQSAIGNLIIINMVQFRYL